MCGVVAIVSRNGPVAEGCLERGIASLNHRGPDGRGSWYSKDRTVALGHTRLSVIDLETGAQPIPNETNKFHIVVNGEFYDFERQRRELESRGHRFRTRSDSEIALHLFEEYGAGAVDHLRGEFAFVLWDENKKALYAFRDRYGVKPLYYSIHHETLYIASEIKALIALGVPAIWDFESVYLGNGLRGADRTPFKGISALEPGHFLRFDEHGLHLQQYWDIDYPVPGAEVQPVPEDVLVRRLRTELEESVRLRLRADVPVACYLSGGLDSSAVLGLAARISNRPVKTFTLRFSEEVYDESDVAAKAADFANADHHEHLVDCRDLADSFADYVYQAETHATNAHGIAKFQLSRVVRDAGIKVVLTGEGADETLFGYPQFRQDLWLHGQGNASHHQRQMQVQQLMNDNVVSKGLLLADGPITSSARLDSELGFTPSWLHVHLSRLASKSFPLNYGLLSEATSADPVGPLLSQVDIREKLACRGVVEQSAYLWAKSMLPNYILSVLGDRSEMAHSVEGRVPFLDHKVGEFLNSVPVDLKIRDGVEKYLLRQAVQDLVTPRVLNRQKHPFLSPPVDLFNGSGFSDLAQDSLRSETAKSVPVLDQKAILKLADQLSAASRQQCRSLEPETLFAMSLIFMHQRFGFSSQI